MFNEERRSKLAEIKAPTEEEYLACVRCGLCLSVCPTYHQSLRETESPRGRVALIRKAVEGELALSKEFTDHVYRCLGCMACNEICPVDIKPANLALETRYALAQIHPQRWKKVVFGGYFSHPKWMERSLWPLRLYQRLGLRWLAHFLPIIALLPRQLRDMERMLPRLPAKPLCQVLPPVAPARGKRRYRVGFFLGCVQSLIFAEGSAATVRVLAENGCEVVTPREVRCCGMPAIGYGEVPAARDLARHNIDLFMREDLEAIITDCATCGATLKGYAHLLADDPQYAEKARIFSQKVRDISEFLAQIPVKEPRGRVEARVTYHDPCHLVRGQHLKDEPRRLIQMVDGLALVEMKEADRCCGSGGTQLITHYETSLGVLTCKMDNAAATEAEIIASGCPGCQLQLGLGVQRFNLKARVMHPVQLLDLAYRGSK